MKSRISCIVLLCVSGLFARSQNADSTIAISPKVVDRYMSELGNRSVAIQNKMQSATEQYINVLKTKEQVLYKQLNKIDSNAAKKIFDKSEATYDKLQQDIKTKSASILQSSGKYFPGIDSALTELKFFQKNDLTGKLGDNLSQIKSTISKIKGLEDQFKATDNVEDFVKQREQFLQTELASFKLPGLEQYNVQAAYYAQQMQEYKEAWEDPSKMEKKALDILKKIPAFNDFMSKNSMIASLLGIPDDYNVSGIAGLQTRDVVQQAIQRQMQLLGSAGAASAQQGIGDAQNSLANLRNKISQGGGDLEMPDGQGNQQHTKTIWKRLEYGVNIQSTRSNNILPTSTAFAGTVGYKINNRSTAGIGLSYNVGWGTDIHHIKVSSQGIGIRSYLDVNIKGNFYATGGYEKNYNHVFTSLAQLSDTRLWQESGLLGISKIVSLRGNLVKKTKLQLLWDFLSYYQIPKTQPILFRVGYNF